MGKGDIVVVDRAGNATQDGAGFGSGLKVRGVAVVFAVMLELPKGIAKKMKWR